MCMLMKICTVTLFLLGAAVTRTFLILGLIKGLINLSDISFVLHESGTVDQSCFFIHDPAYFPTHAWMQILGTKIRPKGARINQKTSVRFWWQSEMGKMKERRALDLPSKKKRVRGGVHAASWDEIRGERMKRGGMSNWDNDQQWWGGTWSARGQRKGRHFATLSRQGDLRERRRKWKNLINEIISQSTSITLHRRTRRRFQAD